MLTLRRLVVASAAIWVLAGSPAAHASIRSRQADALAVSILRPARSQGPTVLFGLPSPVRAGAAVFEAAPGARIRPRRLAHRTWLFWEDQAYQALFEHPSVLLLVDAQTGRVAREASLAWYPLVDGRRPAFLASSAAYHDRRYWVFSRGLPAVTVTRASVRAHGSARPPAAILPGELHHDCLIMIGDRQEPILSGSFAAMLQWARGIGLPVYPDQATTVATLKSTVALARTNGCDDVFLFISGHGTPPPNWEDPIKHRVYPGGPPAVNLGSNGGPAATLAPDGTWTVPRNELTPDDLKALIDANPDIDFKVKIESCFSGRFADTLTAPAPGAAKPVPFAPNLLVLELSSPADRPSFGQIKVDKFDAHHHLIAHDVPANDNPFGAGEFANGDYHGLQQWAHSTTEIKRTDGDLAQGIADSFGLGLPFNAATTNVLAPNLQAQPLLFRQPLMFRAKVVAHEVPDGVSVRGYTHGRFDTVQLDAPAGDSITSFDAHGHVCVLIDDAGNVYTNTSGGITLPPGRRIVSVRCDRKPVDDEIEIAITLGSGNPRGKTVHVTIVKDGQAVVSEDLAVHP